jgi:hypothetical protein
MSEIYKNMTDEEIREDIKGLEMARMIVDNKHVIDEIIDDARAELKKREESK